MNFNVLEYGAKGDGKTNDVPSIQKAIDTCSEALWADQLPDYYGPALKIVSVQEPKLDGFKGKAAHEDQPIQVIQ